MRKSIVVSAAVIILHLVSCSGTESNHSKSKFPIETPTGIYATGGTYANKVVVSWNAALWAEMYYVYRTDSPTFVTTQIGTSTSFSYEDTDVKDGYYYYYQVQAYSESKGYSDYSTMACGYTEKVGDTWARLMSLTTFSPRNLYQAIVFDSKAWIIGGFDGAFVQAYTNVSGFKSSAFKNDIWCTSDLVNWTMVTDHPLFENLSNHASAAVVHNNMIWIMGGRALDTTYNDDVWCSGDGANWCRATGTAAFGGRAGHRAVSFNGYMWVVGGINGSFVFLRDVWRSSDGITWTKMADNIFPTGRIGFSLCVFNNKMWAIGGSYCTYYTSGVLAGQTKAINYNSEVFSSSDGIIWVLETDTPGFSPRDHHTCTVHNGRMWIMGGGTNVTGADGLLVPNGAGDETNLPYPPADHWIQLAIDDGDLMMVSTEGGVSGTTYRDLYQMQDITIVKSIKTVQLIHQVKRTVDNTANARGIIKTHGAVYESPMMNPSIDQYGYYGWDMPTNPNTGISWTSAEIQDLQAGIAMVKYTTGDVYCSQVGMIIWFTDDTNSLYLSEGQVASDTWSSPDGINWTKESDNSDVKPRTGHCALSFDGKLVIFTGVSTDSYAYDIWYR